MRGEAQVFGPIVVAVTVDVVDLVTTRDVLRVLHHPDDSTLKIEFPVELHAAVVPLRRCHSTYTASSGLPSDQGAAIPVEDEQGLQFLD